MATTVKAAFEELLDRLTLTSPQRAAAQGHASRVKAFLSEEFVMSSDGAWVTGSFSRGTLTRWQRDVDVMAALSVSKYDDEYGSDSRKLLYFVRDALNDEYESTTVSSRQLSIKLDFSDFVVDVVPCFRRKGGGYLMPNGSHGWRATNPPFHATLMKTADEAHDYRLKPLVRLMKAWNIANSSHLASIHVELLVQEMWDEKTIGPYPSAVAKTLKAMPSWLRSSFADPWTGSSRAIDADLSDDDRSTATSLAQEDAKRAAAAEAYRAEGESENAIERWNIVYNHKFPAYG
jgi:hypothetical protein